MVELALIMPVLLLVFLGVVDFSRLYHGYVAATNAARVGAQAAMRYEVPNQTVVTAIQQEPAPGMTLSSVVISPTVRSAGGSVEIAVTYVFRPQTPLISSFLGGDTVPLVARATGRVY